MKNEKYFKSEFRVLKKIFKTYSLNEKLGFVFNMFQSVFSQLIIGFLSWYLLDMLFEKIGNRNIVIWGLLIAITYFALLIPIFGYLMEKAQVNIKKHFSDEVISKYFFSNPEIINKMHSSYIMEILQEDVSKVSQFGGWQFVVLMQAIISGVASILLITKVSVTLFILMLFFGMIPLIFDIVYAKKNKELLTKARTLYDEKAELTLNALDNQIICRLYNIMDESADNIFCKHKEMSNVQKEVYCTDNKVSFVHNLIYNMIYRAIILLGGLSLFSIGKISIGQIPFLLSVGEGLSFFLSSTGSYIRNIQELIISKNRIESFFNDKKFSNFREEMDHEKIESIELNKLFYKYLHGKDYVLKDLNYKFVSGRKYLITGDNGKGKSTLLKLIFGLYKPTKGTIKINNKDNVSLKNRNISYVPQEPKIFSGTLLENLITDNCDIKKGDIDDVLKIVKLDNLFNEKTVIQENGSNFSKGQLMRIVLCRALIQKTNVLLLDEIDANLNEEILNEILNNIMLNNPEMCIIAISHNKEYKIYEDFINIKI
ncbi:MAG: ATP-binding cassette domain-containing protein [Filifactoraceae bacterium]